uniref:Uncharacterized protein n=1 Tax=Anguilla anguilla TaxID=7936 RepID=A0A0E9U9Y6_ANGAN
MIYYCPFIFL